MATYYKYAERDVNSQVDWGKIGADITNMLQEQARLKAAKEQAFDDQTQAMSKTLEDMPTGENQMLNEKYMDFVSNAQEYRLQQDRLVKGGLLDPRDYKRSRQRFSDDTARFFDLGKKAQEEYKIKADRMAKGTSSFMEQDMMIMVEGLGNLQNLSPVINAANGSVQIGRMVPGKDGVMQLDGNELMGVQEIENRIKFTKDKFDKDTFVTNKSNLLGEFITAEMIEAGRAGGINYVLTRMNKKERADIDAALLAMGNEVIASPYDAASVLGDWTGEEYHLETNKEKADKDPKAIYSYVDANGTLQVDLTPDQEKDVRDYIREQVLFTFADKNDIPRMSNKQYPPSDVASGQAAKIDRVALSEAEAWRDLAVGNSEEQTAAMSALMGSTEARKQGLTSITPVKDAEGKLIAYDFTYEDSNKNIRKSVGSDLNDWMRGVNEVTGTIDPEIIDRAVRGYDRTPMSTTTGTGQEREGAGELETMDDGYRRLIKDEYGIVKEVFTNDEDETVDKLNTLFNTTPGLQDFVVDTAGSFGNEIVIKKGTATVATFDLDDMTADTQERYLKTVLDLAQTNATVAQKKLVTDGKLQRKRRVSPPGQAGGGGRVPRVGENESSENQ